MRLGLRDERLGRVTPIRIQERHMKNVLLRAPVLTISGYGVHSRQIFEWLSTIDSFKLSTQILSWGDTPWMIEPTMESGLIEKIMATSSDIQSSGYDLSFQVQLPDEWDVSLADVNIGVSAFVETDRCHPEWINAVNKMDAVIVPTEFIKSTILNTGDVTTPIFVIPEWYYPQIDNDDSVDDLSCLNIDTKFNFLVISQMTGMNPENDRKNLFNTIKWFCESFSDDSDVGLILKTNFGRGTTIDRQVTRTKIREIISQVRVGKYPKIHLIHGNMSSSEIVSLYKQESVMCLINLTRGEGFGLPILEAAACGIPVMVTGWSGHLDFLKLGKFLPIKYKLVDIHPTRVDNRIFLEGMKWADPSESDFKEKVVKFRHKYYIPQQWARELSSHIKREFSKDAIIETYNDFLGSISIK